MDFTQKKYVQLCEAICASSYKSMGFTDFLKKPGTSLEENLIILRHDVDDRPGFALAMAQTEFRFGLKGTYYFRYPQAWDKKIIRHIYVMGHEVGYHYQCMDAAKGDAEKAIELFKKELEMFRKIVPVTSIAMHGNPLSRWDNRDLWKQYNFRDFGIAGETYLSMDFTKALYYTDTGRTWEDGKYNLKDIIPSGQDAAVDKPIIRTTDELIALLAGEKRNLYINTHPDRWANNYIYWAFFFFFDVAVNIVKSILLRMR